MKRCGQCGVEKELSEFYKRKNSKDGHRGQCKVCMAEYDRQYQQDNDETLAEYRRQYYMGNVEAIAEYNRQYQQDNAEAIAENNRRYYMGNVEAIAEYQRQYRERHPEKIAARNAVSYAVLTGRLPHISTCLCVDCQALGIDKQAQDRHHHLGYEPEHWLHFEELCRSHHRERHT